MHKYYHYSRTSQWDRGSHIPQWTVSYLLYYTFVLYEMDVYIISFIPVLERHLQLFTAPSHLRRLVKKEEKSSIDMHRVNCRLMIKRCSMFQSLELGNCSSYGNDVHVADMNFTIINCDLDTKQLCTSRTISRIEIYLYAG